ncbi:glycosyltransferase like family 2-domain-containing protein [Aspergillus egyptiacus]|nr:glycosyltransferase like family 2-domain-containing protein [Aspergillus egyptiacus]
MRHIFCLTILLPLALTSPHVEPYVGFILSMAMPVFAFVAAMSRTVVQDKVQLLFRHLYRYVCHEKCRAWLMRCEWQFLSISPIQLLRICKSLGILKACSIIYALTPSSLTSLAKALTGLLPTTLHDLAARIVADRTSTLFVSLFIFRCLRLIVHLISFWLLYRPTPIPTHPTIRPRDCTVILPTVDPQNPDFAECLTSCLQNQPGAVIIVTVGPELTTLTKQIIAPYKLRFPLTTLSVKTARLANKRHQVAHGLHHVHTKITILLDDHVFWPSPRFLQTLIAPFEDPQVGIVGTNKRVRRTDTGLNAKSFWNMLGALYLERHNFEIRATNALDGGVFVVSGRTSAHRSSILTDPNFLHAFTNERFFFGKFGPLNADDDNFITRWNVTNGHKIKIQYSPDARIETTLGTYPKFLSQCLRWVRTTWRSNSAALFTDRTVWYRQPWCVYAVYVSSFVNFALFYDAALIYTLLRSDLARDTPYALTYLVLWIFVSKMVKLTPYFLREPQDLLMLPGYFVFAYFHSLVKLYAGLTFWNTNWGGRDLDAINSASGSASPSGSVASRDRDTSGTGGSLQPQVQPNSSICPSRQIQTELQAHAHDHAQAYSHIPRFSNANAGTGTDMYNAAAPQTPTRQTLTLTRPAATVAASMGPPPVPRPKLARLSVGLIPSIEKDDLVVSPSVRAAQRKAAKSKTVPGGSGHGIGNGTASGSGGGQLDVPVKRGRGRPRKRV